MLLRRYLFLLLMLWLVDDGNSQFHLYYSSDESKKSEYDYDCLDYFTTNDDWQDIPHQLRRQNQQVIPFCRRDHIDDSLIIPEKNIPVFTFEELNERDVSSLDLYAWSAPIDLIERYQAYRELKINNTAYGSLSKFYNCSLVHRFGSFCQYYFNSTASKVQELDDIFTDLLKKPHLSSTGDACYVHLNCARYSYSWCLDWREICDRKVDCWPQPVDEERCDEFERNECDEGQYRCHNGQCIPQEYLMDNPFAPDCIDATDEDMWPKKPVPDICLGSNPTIECSEIAFQYPGTYPSKLGICSGSDICRSEQRSLFNSFLVSRTTNSHLSDYCWPTMICLIKATQYLSPNYFDGTYLFNGSCNHICTNTTACRERMRTDCKKPLFAFPAEPIAWNDVYLFYSSNRTNSNTIAPDYVCFNDRFCGTLTATIQIPKTGEPGTLLSCQEYNSSLVQWVDILKNLRATFRTHCVLTATDVENECPEKTHFRCGKKCLSKRRLVDGMQDCYDNSDELYNNSCALNDKYRIPCAPLQDKKYVDKCMLLVFTRSRDLHEIGPSYGCRKTEGKLLHFPALCDGYVEYVEYSNKTTETDETSCEEWLCDNQYTRCDGVWNCQNGADEISCFRPLCNGQNAHPCLLWNSTEPICLPISRAGDGIIDCIGGTDERHLCRNLNLFNDYENNAYLCWDNQTNNEQITNQLITIPPEKNPCIDLTFMCDNQKHCNLLEDDEHPQLCQNQSLERMRCTRNMLYRHPASFIRCDLDDSYKELTRTFSEIFRLHFHLANVSLSRDQQSMIISSMKVATKAKATMIKSFQDPANSVMWNCHSGIPVNFLRNGSVLFSNEGEKRCLCPPTFYGAHCEYQNERITVTLQIGSIEGQTPFTFVLYLLDDQYHIVQSFHQINYLSSRDCQKKFTFYMLYSSRPKVPNRKYSVRIDAFETKTFSYRASWFYPISYDFLPVYRLSILLTIPMQSVVSENTCSPKCLSKQGECSTYINTDQSFCRCKPGWSGVLCNHAYQCDCAPGSMCVGSWNNRSICVCPLGKFGPRCYLTNNACNRTNILKCQHQGQCVPSDVRIRDDSPTTCICPIEFYNTYCQSNQSRIDISFASLSSENIPAQILLHFITVRTHPHFLGTSTPTKEWGPHERLSTFKKIPFDRISVTVYWNNVFHLLFAQDQHDMYLLLLQTKHNPSTIYNVSIESHRRCPPIRELLNHTIVSFPRLRRVKYYHTPCQRHPDLPCFHDEDQFMCLCTYDRRANCFTFDYHMKYSCSYKSYCENEGQCFQNSVTCPSAATCACPTCYFGTRCQLTTKGFGLPLDVLLGYQIWPGTAFSKQPRALHMSLVITVLLFVLGIINGILSIPTFYKLKAMRDENGSHIYLYVASIVSLSTMILFTLKFVLFVLSQLHIITSRLVLIGQCKFIDFLLKTSLQTGDWLCACVAVLGACISMKGLNFNRTSSKKLAKWVIFLIIIFVSGTSIHEAYYGTLLNDSEEQRTWCIVRYPTSSAKALTKYTTFMSVLHFIGPFVVNIISSIAIIAITTRSSSKLKKEVSYRTHLRLQLQKSKHLIIGPIVLVLFTIPRVILSFTLECMKSARDPVTLFLIGYYVSFIPPILTFMAFILPSKVRMEEFKPITLFRRH